MSDTEPVPADAESSADDDVTMPRGPLQGLQDLSKLMAEHPVNTGAFVRGLTIGALVGAAIAGSAIWRRWRRRSGPG